MDIIINMYDECPTLLAKMTLLTDNCWRQFITASVGLHTKLSCGFALISWLTCDRR